MEKWNQIPASFEESYRPKAIFIYFLCVKSWEKRLYLMNIYFYSLRRLKIQSVDIHIRR